MEVLSLLSWIIVFGLGIWAFIYFNRVGRDNLVWVHVKLFLKLFFYSFPVSWLALYLSKEMTHPIVIVGSFYIIGLLSLCSLTIFLNLLHQIKENIFLSTLSWFLVPLIVGFKVLRDLREYWPQHQSDFEVYLPIIISFFAVEVFLFIRFRRYLSSMESD
jgi:hypothetical protein